MREKQLFEYAVVRVMPRVEREEFINVGVIVYCPGQKFLRTLFTLDEQRLLCFAPQLDIEELRNHLHNFERISLGLPEGGLIPVKRTSKWGYIKPSMAHVAEAKYDQAWEFHAGCARVRSGGLYGLVDSLGKEAIKPQYTLLTDLGRHLWAATNEHGTGVVDPAGNVRIPLAFDQVFMEGKALVRVTRGNKFAYLRLHDGSVLWKENGFDAASTH